MSCPINTFNSNMYYMDKISHSIERLFILEDCSSYNNKHRLFYSKTNVPVKLYIIRVLNFFKSEESTIVISLIYLDRIRKRNRNIINKGNFHKLFLMALTTACKFNEDCIYLNSFYCQVGGIALKEFNYLEKIFLMLIDYSLIVKNDEYENMLESLLFSNI